METSQPHKFQSLSRKEHRKILAMKTRKMMKIESKVQRRDCLGSKSQTLTNPLCWKGTKQ